MMNERFHLKCMLKKPCEVFYTSKQNIEFITHHLAHAWAAVLMSPFNEAVIIVFDGSWNRYQRFSLWA